MMQIRVSLCLSSLSISILWSMKILHLTIEVRLHLAELVAYVHTKYISLEMFQVIDDKRLVNYLLPFYFMLQQKQKIQKTQITAF